MHRFIPDYIKGDLDSLRDDVKTFYESHVSFLLIDFIIIIWSFTKLKNKNKNKKGCKIIRDSSQEETDFVKCTQIIQTIEQKNVLHNFFNFLNFFNY